MSSEGSVEIKDLVKTYTDDRGRPTFTAVKNISLNIDNGEFMVLVGPSGCGKSTTLRMVAGLEKITIGLDRDRSLDPQFERPIAGA